MMSFFITMLVFFVFVVVVSALVYVAVVFALIFVVAVIVAAVADYHNHHSKRMITGRDHT